MKMLKVKAAGSALVPDFAAMDAGILRFIGRSHDASVGPQDASGVPSGGWVRSDEAVSIPFRLEYVQEVQAGCLTVCDEESARLCGVPFSAPKASKNKAE